MREDEFAEVAKLLDGEVVLAVVGTPATDFEVCTLGVWVAMIDSWQEGELALVSTATGFALGIVVLAQERPIELLAGIRIETL